MTACDASMRPFRPVNDTEIRCDLDAVHIGEHRATLRDYAYPGSTTVIGWHDADRRTFRGEWPGACDATTPAGPCILPDGHNGNHAA